MKKSVLTLFIFAVCLLTLVSFINLISATSVGIIDSDMTEGKVVYTPPIIINYSIISTNSSNYWGSRFYTDYGLLVPYTGATANVDLGIYNFTTTGRVGIGTATPESLLHLVSDGSVELILHADIDNINETDVASILYRRDGSVDSLRIGVEGTAGQTFTNSLANTPYIYSVSDAYGIQFATDDELVMTIKTGEDVRIEDCLEVVNEIRLGTNGSQTDPGFTWEDDGDTGIFRAGTNVLGFTTAGSEAMRIDSLGNVGIGINIPLHPLQIDTTNNAIYGSYVNVSGLSMKIMNPADDTGEAVGIGLGVSTADDNVGGAIIFERVGSQTYGNLHFATKPSGGDAGVDIPIRMTILSDGKVGIGTTAPTHLLNVDGDVNITGTSYLGDIVIDADNITVNNIISKDGNITFYNSTNNEIVRFTDNGRIGIGTASPGSKLTVYTAAWNTAETPLVNITNLDSNAVDADGLLVRGGANNAASDVFKVQDYSGNTDFVVVGHGKVGIGTPSPNFKIEWADATRNGFLDFGLGGVAIGGATGNTLTLWTDNTQQVAIDTSGNVGIGTTSPSHKLNVIGDVNITGNLISKTINDVSSEGKVLSMGFNSDSIKENKALDSSSYNNHGTVSGATFNPTGSFNDGGSYYFDGIDDNINLTQKLPHEVNITYMAWLNPFDASWRRVFNTEPLDDYGWYTTNNMITSFLSCITSSTGSVPTGTWTHFAYTYNGTTSILYINGVLNEDNSNDCREQGGIKYIGLDNTGEDFKGSIDEVRIYNRTLSNDEISQIYHQRDISLPSFVSQKDVYVDFSGNVGINETSPTSLLHVNGNLNVTGTGAFGGIYAISPDGSESISISHDNTVTWIAPTTSTGYFKTSKANTKTVWIVQGRGTGEGRGQFRSGNSAALWFMSASGDGACDLDVSIGTSFHLLRDAVVPINTFGGSTSGVTQEFKIYGYREGDEKRYLQIEVGGSADDTVDFTGLTYYLFDGNVSAVDYMYHSTVFDKSQGSALDFIQDADYYLKDGEVNHEKFYGYTGTFDVTDFSRNITKQVSKEWCDDPKDVSTCFSYLVDEVIYPYTIEEKRISLISEVDVLRQAVFELNERVIYLEENCVMK